MFYALCDRFFARREENKMKIAVGCDHAGIHLKPLLIDYLEKNGIGYTDFGTKTEDSCNYAEYGAKVAEEVAAGNYDFGILICGTGIGMSIVANKVPGIRCAHCTDEFSARATRMHNDANVLACGERITGPGVFLDIVKAFLSTPFEGGRHLARIAKITETEEKYSAKK